MKKEYRNEIFFEGQRLERNKVKFYGFFMIDSFEYIAIIIKNEDCFESNIQKIKKLGYYESEEKCFDKHEMKMFIVNKVRIFQDH